MRSHNNHSASIVAVKPNHRTAELLDWLTVLSTCYRLDLSSLAPVSSDAGFRRYFRLSSDSSYGPTVIAVDAPPPEKNREFVMISQLFAAAGVHVPQVLESDFDRGFMLITDLGRTIYLDALKDPQGLNVKAKQALFDDALSALIRWQCATRTGVLPDYDEALLRRELELFPEWMLGRHLNQTVDRTIRETLDITFTLLIQHALAQPRVFVHRDYMPRNLMVCTPHNPGVIDFQDAVMGPITYDVVSLFRDAFISWDEAFQLECVAKYWERATQAKLPVPPDFTQFYRDFEWMGLQRHLKVLGIFARLHYRDNKPHYLADTPRFFEYVRTVAQRYREFLPLARLLDQYKNF